MLKYYNKIQMNPTVYLKTGDLITISHQGLYLAIQSLTQSIPSMKQSISNSLNSVFVLSTQKNLEKSLEQQKSLITYNQDDIYYSEPILLYHLLSGKFLSYNKDIENKASIQLIGSFKENCKFSIKPIFKCQTVITRKIRNEQSVIICPSEAYNLEGNVAMTVLRNDSRKGDQSFVLMKKNQTSKFQLSRKSEPLTSPQSLSNIYVYQLLNIETRKNLYMTQSQSKNKDLITFEKSINQFASYFDIRLKDSHFGAIGVTEQQIKYGVPFYFHSWKEDKYLSINIIGDACLTQIPNQQAQFTIESYSDLQFNKDSVVRIKHIPSQKYLSLNSQGSQIQITHQVRLIDTYMIVKVPIQELRLNVFINNAHQIIQRELSGKKITYSNRQSIFKVLKQLINFIYGDEITISDFLSMKNKISCRLSSNDQKLLANIGIITTLVRMCRAFIQQITKEPESKEFQQKDNTDQQIIIIYTMMSIVGICNRNASNMKILVQEMPLLYESLVTVSGIIESFYNLLKDSKELLLVIQNTSHKIGRKEMPSMEVLISMLSEHEIDIPTRCKILKLLQVFVIVNHKQKILGHQAILLKSFMQGKLDHVMLPMKSNDHEELYIYLPQKKTYQEIQEVINSRRAYEKQLQLVKTQIQLLCSLCVNSNSECFNYAKKIIPQEMLYRYLKANLQPDFKQIFMKVLIDVYLSNLALKNNSMPKSFIICQKDGQRRPGFSKIQTSSVRDNLLTEGQELSVISNNSPSHSKIIENIQNYILEITKKSIINEIIDSSFYMNLKSLRKFLDLRILDRDQVVQFRLLLIQYIAKFSKVSFKEEEKKKIVLQVIKIMTDYFNQHLQFISEQLVLMLRDQKIPHNKLYQRFLLFIGKFPFFNSQIQQVQLNFLPKLIKQSIEFNSPEIFVAASSLFKLINERLSVFFYRLRQKIIIDSDWSYKFYCKIQKLKKSLNQQIQAYMISKGDQKQTQYVQQQLNQLVKQLNFCFFENSTNNSTELSQLTQNIYRQMNLLEMIVNFLNESQEKFKDGVKGNVDVYSTCFQFIGLYLQGNRENFHRFQDKYLDIKFVFEHQDRGQIKFLNYLIKMPNARQLMIDQIIDCVIMSFQHNTEPNPYTLLTLINAISDPYIDKQRIAQLVQKLLASPKTFQSILKVNLIKNNSYAFSWSYDPKSQNYHSEWPIYAYLLIKLLLILIEQSSQRTVLSIQLQKYLSVNALIQLLKIQDLLSSTSMVCLQGSLLKSQAIKLFLKIYLPLLEKESNEIENISSFIHLTLQSLAYVKEEHEGVSTQLFEQVSHRASDHGQIIFQAEIKTKTKLTIKQFEKYFNPIYNSIVEYFPFIIKLLQKLLNSNSYIESNPSKKSEFSLYMDNIYRKMRDFVQFKLTYKQFNAYSKQYHSAINNCQDILKKKLGLNLDVEENQQDQDVGQVELNDYFINTKIQNTVKCYKYASSANQIKIYEAFLFMFHSQKFKKYFRNHQISFPIQLNLQEMQKIRQMMLKYINLNNDKFSSTVRLFNFFARFNKSHCLNMSFSRTREELLFYLCNQKQDTSNDKLCTYLAVSSQLFVDEINKQQVVVKKTQAYFPFKQDFIQRIRKRIQSEKTLYSSYKIFQQAGIYKQRKLLVFQQIDTSFNIELCLQWIRNMTVITPFNLKEKLNSSFFMQVVDLLKAYTFFLKQFNMKYVSYEIYNKINLCLSIIFHYISGLTQRSFLINYLIQRQIWNDLNLILGLDDGLTRNFDELDDTQTQTFKKVFRNQQKINSRIYLKQCEKLYFNSKKNYKQIIPEQFYPLLPMKSLFCQMKSNVISILKQFKHLSLQVGKQIFSRIDMSLINRNIFEVYRKHHRLFPQYDISSLQFDIQYDEKSDLRSVAENFIFQNGIDLSSIKMYISSISGSNDLKTQYNNLRIEALTTKKIQSAFSSLFTFIKDFFFLFISCFLCLCRKSNGRYKKQQEIDEKKLISILNFFLTKTGRVEILFNENQLLSTDFIIRPECFVSKETKDKFIERINFVSMQLKLESIYRQARVFLLRFQNQIDFYRRFSKIAYITFLTRNIQMLTYLNFAVIVAQNIVLIINSDSKQEYFTTNTFDQPFVWLQVASTVIAGSVLAAYLIKDFNLLIKNINMKLKIRGSSYGSNYNSYNFLIKFWIKFTMVITDASFAYRILFTLIICLVFYNKLFAALLMLDIFFQIPTLKNLLMSVWRPKIQLILALVSFVLLQYFFSIFMFFNFKTQTLGFCKTLGSCFGFVFVTTYKAVGGFVGYLFVKNGSQIEPVNFFQIFQDIYVVLIFQIFFGLILAIIIDAFSLIRTQQTARKDYLNGCCIVCNLDKAKFNSSTMSFKAHIAITHNIWNYFYYYEYINHKSALKRTAFQREIYLSKTATWLPIDTSFDVIDEKMTLQITEKQKIKSER